MLARCGQIADGDIKWCYHYGNSIVVPQKMRNRIVI